MSICEEQYFALCENYSCYAMVIMHDRKLCIACSSQVEDDDRLLV